MKKNALKAALSALLAAALVCVPSMAEENAPGEGARPSPVWQDSAAKPGTFNPRDELKPDGTKKEDLPSEEAVIPVYGYIGTLEGEPGEDGYYGIDIDDLDDGSGKTTDLSILAKDIIRVKVPTQMFILYTMDPVKGISSSGMLSSVGTFRNTGRNDVRVYLSEAAFTPPEKGPMALLPGSAFDLSSANPACTVLLKGENAGAQWLAETADVGMSLSLDPASPPVQQLLGTLPQSESRSFLATGAATQAVFTNYGTDGFTYQSSGASQTLSSFLTDPGDQGFSVKLTFKIEIVPSGTEEP